MADYGIKVSKEGFDVKTCNVEDLAFTSELNTLKAKSTGTLASVGDVTHGLGYLPIFFTTCKKPGTERYTLIGDDMSYCDTSKLYSYRANTRYYLFYQQGA